MLEHLKYYTNLLTTSLCMLNLIDLYLKLTREKWSILLDNQQTSVAPNEFLNKRFSRKNAHNLIDDWRFIVE